ncbi:MAG: shikimate dehydrogenase [Nitrospirae bacterium]|nr:shikimate dehydrogenase [Nitrospirota bacterium]MBI3352116.1 shikimate dehydrogenase [Nitrospirota bacterium]
MTGKTRCVAIIGHPVSHSLSPQMHQAAFDALGLDYCYIPFDILPKDLEQAVYSLTLLGFLGFNVTIPHKEKMVSLVDKISPEASIIGAVNTVRIHKGKLWGFNTDGPGFVESLRKKWSFSPKNKRIVLLGAGGAAKAVATQLCFEKVKSIGIVNRTPSKRSVLKKQLNQYFPEIEVVTFSYHEPDLKTFIQCSDLLINATSVGLHAGAASPVPPDFFHRKLKVYDLIYNPRMTPFLEEAKQNGCPILNGSSMLVFQGALAFKIWTGKMPPVSLMAKSIQ